MASQLDHEVDDSLDDLRRSLDLARAAIARDPSAATQTQRDQLAANLRCGKQATTNETLKRPLACPR